MRILRDDSLPYGGRTFHRLQLRPEPEDTIHTLYETVTTWLDETNATYFRVDVMLPEARHDVDPRGYGELSVVIVDGAQRSTFLQTLQMARAFVSETRT